jgi:hypothetical protein
MKQASPETVMQGYLHVTFFNGSRNLLDADTITERSEVVDRLGRWDIKVRGSAGRNPDHFTARYDLTAKRHGWINRAVPAARLDAQHLPSRTNHSTYAARPGCV